MIRLDDQGRFSACERLKNPRLKNGKIHGTDCKHGIDTVSIQYRCCIDTVSVQYWYYIDTVSIRYRYCIDTVSTQDSTKKNGPETWSEFWKKLNQKSQKFMIFRPIACLIWPGSRISGQKPILGPKNKVNWKIRSWVSKFTCRVTIFKISKNENTKITKIHDIWAHRMF